MFGREAQSIGGLAVTAAGLIALGATSVSAEPSIHYAGRPAVLPAPVDYGTPYRAPATVIERTEDTGYASYRRTYSTPVRRCESTRVVYTSPTVRYETPVYRGRTYYRPAYERVYRAPRRVVHVATPCYRGHHHKRHYYRKHYRPVSRTLRGHVQLGHRPRHHGHRRLGLSVGYGRGHHRGYGGFSFSYGH